MFDCPATRRWLTGALVFALIPVSSGMGQEERKPQLHPDAPYTAQKSGPVTHEVDFSIVVTPPNHCKVLKVWMPVPQSDEAQQIRDSRYDTRPLKVEPQLGTEPVYGNRFAYFEFQEPQGAQIIRHRFQAKVWEQRWNVDAKNVADVEEWPKAFAPYLQRQSLADEEQFHTVLQEIIPQRRGPGADLPRIMHWIDENLTYDHINASLVADANHALTERRGNCSDYHGLCATMGRALGYPTRVTYGLALFPKNSPSHCKLEAYLPPHGWVNFDLSETQKLVKAIRGNTEFDDAQKDVLATAARKRLLAGFRENSWLSLTKGTGYELVPKASQRVQVIRTAYIEADGRPLPEPDPANADKREFSWMTVHEYRADKPFKLPFKDASTLLAD